MPAIATTAAASTQTTPLPPLPAYGLHALLAARSPVLYGRLASQPGPPYEIELDGSDVNLTTDGVNVALGSLYSGRNTIPDSRLAVGILAAALLFGLDALRDNAWQSCLARWRSDDGLVEGIRFVLDQQARDRQLAEYHHTSQQQQQSQQHEMAPAPGLTLPQSVGLSRSSSGSVATQSTNAANSAPSTTATPHNGHAVSRYQSPYAPLIGPLLPELLEKLTRQLPSDEHEAILTTLPFALVKTVLESPALSEKMPSMMARNDFARKVISRRRKALNEPGVEESVVMAFGGDSGAAGGVEVIRRERGARKKQLWKAGR